MFRYILKRIFIFIPTLFAISLIAFWLGKIAPGDPVETCRGAGGESEFVMTSDAYEEIYEEMGLNKPMFYFALSTAAYPDTLHKIPGRYRQKSLSKLIDQYGNWDDIQVFKMKTELFSKAVSNTPEGLDQNNKIALRRASSRLLEEYKDVKINSHLKVIESTVFESKDSLTQLHFKELSRELIASYADVKNKSSRVKQFIPDFKWYGFDNQYHAWWTNFIKGDFGMSCLGGQSVIERIKTPIFWTLIINLIVIVLVYILAIPLGVFSAVKKDSFIDKTISLGLFMLYSLPTFWIGTMLLVFFTNPEYGMNWFEGAGLGDLPSSAPFWDRFWETARHLILPVFCLTYGSLAFMSRQMRGGLLEVLNQDYIRTAKAKGLNNNQVLWKHAFRNALFPMITIFAVVFPAAVTGSVVIEVIFNLPGMGREVVRAIESKDWPVLYTILMLVAILTMLGNLVADILFAWADPRVKFK